MVVAKLKISAKENYNFSFFLKIISSFFVVYNHIVSYKSVVFLIDDAFNLKNMINLFLFSICKSAVPIFLMITGYYSLRFDKHLTVKKNFLTTLKLYAYLVIGTLIYLFLFFDDPLNIDNLIFFYAKNITNIYWYFFLIIGINIVIPYIKKITDSSSNMELLILIFISVLLYSFSYINKIFFGFEDISSWIKTVNFNMYIGYVLIGHLLWRFSSKITQDPFKYGSLSFLFMVLGSILNVNLILWNSVEKNKFTASLFDDRTGIIIAVISISVFVLSMSIFNDDNKRHCKNNVASFLSRCTLFVFLFSDHIIKYIKINTGLFENNVFVHRLFLCLLIYGISMLLGGIYFLIKRYLINFVNLYR